MAKWDVGLMEYERGWGSRLDEVKRFDTYEEAKTFQENFNAQNTELEAPDWYMVATPPSPVEVE